MNILICGINGKMGRTVYNAVLSREEAKVVCGVDKFSASSDLPFPVYNDIRDAAVHQIDCIIDFSARAAVYEILPFALEHKIPCVLAVTGYSPEEIDYINSFTDKLPLFRTGNFSLGINVVSRLAQTAAAMFKDKADIEIVEAHHNQKIDAPSGTALMLFDAVKKGRGSLEPVLGREGIGKRTPNEVGIHAIRGGSIVGKHEVMFILNNEVITIKHEAETKAVFASGAVAAAIFMKGKAPGLYNMDDVVGELI